MYCIVIGCYNKKLYPSLGLCKRCYLKWWHGEPIVTARPLPDRLAKWCRVSGCTRQAGAKGLCRAHYARRRNGLSADKPIRGQVPGRFFSEREGYWMIYDPDERRCKPEHRALMEKELGRKLTRSEVVHHKDRDKTNNSLSNLIVLTPAQHNKAHIGDQTICPKCSPPVEQLCQRHKRQSLKKRK